MKLPRRAFSSESVNRRNEGDALLWHVGSPHAIVAATNRSQTFGKAAVEFRNAKANAQNRSDGEASAAGDKSLREAQQRR